MLSDVIFDVKEFFYVHSNTINVKKCFETLWSVIVYFFSFYLRIYFIFSFMLQEYNMMQQPPYACLCSASRIIYLCCSCFISLRDDLLVVNEYVQPLEHIVTRVLCHPCSSSLREDLSLLTTLPPPLSWVWNLSNG